MPFVLTQRLRSFRKFIILLCIVYLFLVFVFHGRLEFENHDAFAYNNIIPRLNVFNIGSVPFFTWKTRIRMRENAFSRNNKTTQELFPRLHFRTTVSAKSMVSKLSPLDIQPCHAAAANVTNNKFHKIAKDMFAYSAFLDLRKHTRFIRVMMLLSQSRKGVKLFCHFQEGPVVDAVLYEMCENHNKHFGGYIFSCLLPRSITQVCSVALSLHKVQDKKLSWISVISMESRSPQYDFGICIPPLFGNISKAYLVEFIELSKILGAQHFFFYDYKLFDDAKIILDYYARKNVVTIIPWKLPNQIKDLSIWYNGQLIAHNDCLYRTMSLAKWIAFSDLDEFIVPHNGTTWKDIIDSFQDSNICGLSFQSAFFDSNAGKHHPSGLISMGSTGRSLIFSKVRTKVLVLPQKIFEVGIHHVSKPNQEFYRMVKVDVGQAFLHHYRRCVANYGMKCDKFVADRTAFKYYDNLKSAFDKSLKEISS